jgi:deoxyribose-phosphate aldolase
MKVNLDPSLLSIAREAIKDPAEPGEVFSRQFDHTLLKADANRDQVAQLCREAIKYGFYSTCVNPVFVPLCIEQLANSPVVVCTVIGFPLGAATTTVKVFEAEEAIRRGAKEVDMVIHTGALKAGAVEDVRADIGAVVEASHGAGARVKVIIETSLLTQEEKITASRTAKEAGADFVKTSTGFSSGGATSADITLIRKTVGPEMGVKASGGIRTFDDAAAMVAAGADRIGSSASVRIIEEALQRRIRKAASRSGSEVDNQTVQLLIQKILE